MKKHEITNFVLLMKSLRCYHRPVYTDDNVVEIYNEEMKPVFKVYKKYIELLSFDLSCSSIFYSSFEEVEEVVSGEIIVHWLTSIINSKPLLEDYDNNLPDERNLWVMASRDQHRIIAAIRLATVRGNYRFERKFVTDKQAYAINSILADNEAFAWYSSIVINKQFDEVVQIVPTFEDKRLGIRSTSWYRLHQIFFRYGELFLKLFYYEDDGREPLEGSKDKFTMLKSDQRLPLKQIRINNYEEDPDQWEPMDCNYESLVKFLTEEKIRRGI